MGRASTRTREANESAPLPEPKNFWVAPNIAIYHYLGDRIGGLWSGSPVAQQKAANAIDAVGLSSEWRSCSCSRRKSLGKGSREEEKGRRAGTMGTKF